MSNVSKPAKKPRRLQFTLTELLLLVIMTFLGMALLAPTFRSDAKTASCLLVAPASVLGALAGIVTSTPGTRIRLVWMGIGTAFGWLLAFGCASKLFPPRMGTCCGIPGAIDCKCFAEAEEIYHRTDYSKTGLQYATTLHTLYGAKGELALVDKTFAQAEFGPNQTPRVGYCFKVLTAQGPSATGGRRSYIDATGKMTLGYAIIAFPSSYGQFELHLSYILNSSGTIFEKDLGPDTGTIAATMTEFDPDDTWVPTQ